MNQKNDIMNNAASCGRDDVQETTPANRTYEESVRRLEEIVTILERGAAPLEQSMALFREGVALADHCASVLHSMKEEMTQLTDPQGRETPFADQENL